MSGKQLSIVFIIVLAFISAITLAEENQANGAAHNAIPSKSSAIVKDEVLFSMENGNEIEMRHIILRGNNTEIGMALGEIAQKDYGVTSLKRYADPIYGKACQEYMARNYPILQDRMNGVAMSYGVAPDNGTFDTTVLSYDTGSLACSQVYFPPAVTENGHARSVKSQDFFRVPVAVYLNKTDDMSGNRLFSRLFLIEIYPDSGYATMAIGAHSLNSVLDGLNSEGLGINILQDPSLEPVANTSFSGDRNSGILSLLMGRLVLETCRTTEEAKIAFLANKVYFSIGGIHYMVYDSTGRSTVVEWNKDDGNIYFTDGNISQPNIMTNHQIFKYSKVAAKDLPVEETMIPYNHPYDTFNRYRTLYNFTSSHQDRFSEEDLDDAISSVAVNSILEYQGAVRPLPMTTLYDVILDLTDRRLKVKCFLHSGPANNATNESTIVFSPYLTFDLSERLPA